LDSLLASRYILYKDEGSMLASGWSIIGTVVTGSYWTILPYLNPFTWQAPEKHYEA